MTNQQLKLPGMRVASNPPNLNPRDYPLGTYFQLENGEVHPSYHDEVCSENPGNVCINTWYYGLNPLPNYPDLCTQLHELAIVSVAQELRVWLDDLRPAPKGWVRAYWPDEVYPILETGLVTELALDHDLGDDARGKGIDVIDWLKDRIQGGWAEYPRSISIISDNGPGRQYMVSALNSLNRLIES